jgi:hypothetical protein
MEKHFPQALTSLIDKQQHNHIQCLYERFEAKPERNSFQFSFNSLDINICSIQVKEKINFLKSIGIFNQDNIITEFDIKTTDYSWYLKINKNAEFLEYVDKIKLLLDEPTLVYLEINSEIIKSDLMIEYIGENIIRYNPKSFRQTDDIIKHKLYSIIRSEIKTKNLYLIGGEMVFFAKLLKPERFIAYTDFESIYNDAIRNFPENKDNIKLINYEKDNLINLETIKVNSEIDNYHLIANTSKHGLGQNLCEEILNLNLNNITIISCNKKSFQRDYLILQTKYYITKIFDVNTNYSVCIYFMILI